MDTIFYLASTKTVNKCKIFVVGYDFVDSDFVHIKLVSSKTGAVLNSMSMSAMEFKGYMKGGLSDMIKDTIEVNADMLIDYSESDKGITVQYGPRLHAMDSDFLFIDKRLMKSFDHMLQQLFQRLEFHAL